MRIEWLNADMTEARVTRGRLWWRRVALVRRLKDGHVIDKGYTSERTLHWVYAAINTWCGRSMDEALDARRDDERTWVRLEDLPEARVVVPAVGKGST